jgi:iron-sulfur cluster assembly protein
MGIELLSPLKAKVPSFRGTTNLPNPTTSQHQTAPRFAILTTQPTMNAPSFLTRRAASVCFSCRRNLLRQRPFSTTPASLAAAFHAYTLPSQPPPAPRNASVPGTSIGTSIDSLNLPRIQQTRAPPEEGVLEMPRQSPASIPEQEAQKSKPDFAAAPSSSPPSPSAATQQQQQQTQPPAQTTSPAAPAPAAPTPTPAPAAKPTRPRSKLRARKAAINFTPAAVDHLRALLDQPEPKLIKVGVRNRGCSGLAYHLEFVDKAGAFDEAVEQDGVKVLIDSKALFSIIGSEMDWVEDKLSQRFVFRNPNISESFLFSLSFFLVCSFLLVVMLTMAQRNSVGVASRLLYDGWDG